MEYLRLFLRRYFAGKPAVTMGNVGCSLRLAHHLSFLFSFSLILICYFIIIWYQASTLARKKQVSKTYWDLSPPQRPLCIVGRLLCCGEAGEKEKESARGTSPARFLFLSIIDILMGIPSGSLCGGESIETIKWGCHSARLAFAISEWLYSLFSQLFPLKVFTLLYQEHNKDCSCLLLLLLTLQQNNQR